MDPYEQFLRGKIKLASFTGFDVALEEINPALKPHTRAIVQWCVKGGNRAVFASFGLHKTATQIETMRIIGAHTGKPSGIVAPLGVRQEFFREADIRFKGDHAVNLRFIRTNAEIDDERTIYVTNYESIREGKIDPNLFGQTSLDEASVLRSYGSKTYQEFLPLFNQVPFKFVATATPSPNRYKELIHYAGYLGIMDTGQALTRFFQRDSTQANNLTLYPHKEEEFWLWVSSWALFIQKPSDLGFSDEGYDLPPLDVRFHEIKCDYDLAGTEKDGQGLLFNNAALGLQAAATEKRNSLSDRVSKIMEIINDTGRKEKIPQGVLREEQTGTSGKTEGAQQTQLRSEQAGVPDSFKAMGNRESRTDAVASTETSNHEQNVSARLPKESLLGKQGSGNATSPSTEAQELRTDGSSVPGAFGETGREMCDLQQPARTGEQESSVVCRSRSPNGEGKGIALPEMQCGAGDVSGRSGTTQQSGKLSEQVIIWCDLNDEQKAVEDALQEQGRKVVSLYGSQSIEKRDELLAQWLDGDAEAFVTKPVMYGAGVNLQQCHEEIFAGIGFKFADFIQAIHRIYRFGQTRTCIIHIIHTEAEREILRTLLAKWEQHKDMVNKVTEIIRKYGLNNLSMQDTLARTIGVERIEVSGERFAVANNDCVIEAKRQPENHVDLMVTSIPFANHYEYTPSYNDFGHTENNDHFWAQMDFLTPELLRILKPGRMYCCHIKDRILFGNVTGTGIPTVSPFHCEAIMHARKHGFDYMGMITIVTDVVRENNQTYRLGWSEQCKDGTKMGVGSPEYVLLFRKPQTDRTRGYADVPVKKSKDDYTRARWQVDAHAFWRSSGNRQLTAEELSGMGPDKLAKAFTEYSLQHVYDYEFHIKIGEELEARGSLPSTFMSLAPGSHDESVWHDVNRMITLNGNQSQRNVEKHVCPLQFDIVDRLIERYSNPDELVYDPFCGLGTVPYRAILKGRRGQGSELNSAYFFDSVQYLQAAEREYGMPDLFSVLEQEAA